MATTDSTISGSAIAQFISARIPADLEPALASAPPCAAAPSRPRVASQKRVKLDG